MIIIAAMESLVEVEYKRAKMHAPIGQSTEALRKRNAIFTALTTPDRAAAMCLRFHE